MTIIYYTSNREKPEFEAKIQANILKQSNLPIISVSQKPMDFGENICVGDVGHSYVNAWRQIIIGAKKAKTDYVIMCEADFLYPKEYFEFKPKGENSYRYDNVWILFDRRRYFYRKKHSEGCQIAKREYLIYMLEKGLEGLPEWFDGRDIPWVNQEQRNVFHTMPYVYFSGEVPAISFKTGRGVRANTNTLKGKENRALELPYWGKFNDLKKEFLC